MQNPFGIKRTGSFSLAWLIHCLPLLLAATEEHSPRRGFHILSNYLGKWTVHHWFVFSFLAIPSIMIISLKSSSSALSAWFKNKATEAKVKLGSKGISSFSEYVLWNAGLSWKWDRLGLLDKQEGYDDFISSFFFVLLCLLVYVRLKQSFPQLTIWVLKKQGWGEWDFFFHVIL